jgi:hypothetical protein
MALFKLDAKDKKMKDVIFNGVFVETRQSD